MRFIEKEKIENLNIPVHRLKSGTADVAKTFPYYNKLLKELEVKSQKLNQLYLNESNDTKVLTEIKKLSKDKTIRAVLKLKRAVMLHAIVAGNKSLQHSVNYTYSDFNRPAENIRIARFTQVLNAAKRIKNPEQFGVSAQNISEIAQQVNEYINKCESPLQRRKERARQAKQCRKMLKEINALVRNQMIPFFENISEEYSSASSCFNDFLNPKKVGRPANRPERKRKQKPVTQIEEGKIKFPVIRQVEQHQLA